MAVDESRGRPNLWRCRSAASLGSVPEARRNTGGSRSACHTQRFHAQALEGIQVQRLGIEPIRSRPEARSHQVVSTMLGEHCDPRVPNCISHRRQQVMGPAVRQLDVDEHEIKAVGIKPASMESAVGVCGAVRWEEHDSDR